MIRTTVLVLFALLTVLTVSVSACPPERLSSIRQLTPQELAAIGAAPRWNEGHSFSHLVR